MNETSCVLTRCRGGGTASPRKLAALLCGLAFTSCTDRDPPSSAQKVVQLHDVRFAPAEVSCSQPIGGQEVMYDVAFTFRLINTSDEDVRLTRVRTYGVVIRATREQDIGTTAHVSTSIPFEATSVVVAARTGDVPVTATMRMGCGTAPVTSIHSREILTTLLVTTETGEYASIPDVVVVQWRPR